MAIVQLLKADVIPSTVPDQRGKLCSVGFERVSSGARRVFQKVGIDRRAWLTTGPADKRKSVDNLVVDQGAIVRVEHGVREFYATMHRKELASRTVHALPPGIERSRVLVV